MKKFNEIKTSALHDIAEKMLLTAQTAPKGRGIESLEYLLAEKKDFRLLQQKMENISKKENIPFFMRDAINIEQAEYIILIGANYNERNLKKCGYCGFDNCEARNRSGNHPCVFTLIDLGIAIGSAACTAAMFHADNRVMYTIGIAALELEWFSPEIKIAFGIPISATSKSPFFDRD